MFVTCCFTISAGEDANSRIKIHFINKITIYNHGTISSKYVQSMPPAVNANNLVLVIVGHTTLMKALVSTLKTFLHRYLISP